MAALDYPGPYSLKSGILTHSSAKGSDIGGTMKTGQKSVIMAKFLSAVAGSYHRMVK